MKVFNIIALVSILSICGQTVLAELPEEDVHFPTYKIDLDLQPELRFQEVALDLQEGIEKLFNLYLHLVPRFIRNFFYDNIELIAARNAEHFREIKGAAEIIGVDPALAYMLNNAYEMGDVLCTSIVARTTEGSVIHGRNLDFAFPDASRNVTFIARFYKGGEYLYDAVMIAGYLGVLTATKPGAWGVTMNARGIDRSVESRFDLMAKILMGAEDVGFYIRDILDYAEDFKELVEDLSSGKSTLPMYLIVSGPGENEGVVISKEEEGYADITYLDDEHWYLVQTNEDHFDGVCKQRCQDAHAHLDALGQEQLNIDTLLEEIMLQSHNFNENTIHTTIFDVAGEYHRSYGFDTDMPYVREASPVTDLPF